MYTVFTSTAVRGVTKNTISTQILFSRASATTSCPGSYCSALPHITKRVLPIRTGLWKNLTSLNKVFCSEVKVLRKNLGCLCRLAACFIHFFKGLCESQMVSNCLLSFLGFFWQCCPSKGAICTAQSHTDVVICI